MSNHEIEGLYMDMGGVLVMADYPRLVEEIAKEMSIKPQYVREVMNKAFVAKPGEDTVEEKIMETVIARIKTAERFNYGLLNLIQLARVQYGLLYVVTTNSFAGIERKFSTLEDYRKPDLIVNSADLGVMKPNPEYWERAYEKTNKIKRISKRKRILVVDDNEDNIDSAQDSGFSTFHFVREEAGNRELKKRLKV